jgi:hypothetical protein
MGMKDGIEKHPEDLKQLETALGCFLAHAAG